MADGIEAIFDIIAALFAVGLSAYAFRLFRVFKGGLMQGPFRMLATAPLVFAVGETAHVMDSLGLISDHGITHVSLEFLFITMLFVGFYQLSKVWTVQTKTSASP